MKTLCGMMLVGLGSLGLLLACDGGHDPATDGGTDAALEDGGQDAGEDAGGGDEGQHDHEGRDDAQGRQYAELAYHGHVRCDVAQKAQYGGDSGKGQGEAHRLIALLGKEHQIMKPNLITGMTAYGEFTKAGSQVEMSKTPQSWDDPLLHVPGSCKPEWTSI